MKVKEVYAVKQRREATLKNLMLLNDCLKFNDESHMYANKLADLADTTTSLRIIIDETISTYKDFLREIEERIGEAELPDFKV